MSEAFMKAEEERRKFIEDCLTYDTPRLASETYPEGVEVSEITVGDGLSMEIYTTAGSKEDEIFLLIHGGAFVYGSRRLDKCFGMHLSRASGIAVANTDYTLLPDTDLRGQLCEIMRTVDLLASSGKKVIHTVGDSAGGYLALITALLINSEDARNACEVSLQGDVRAGSANLICTMYKTSEDTFPGIYFDKEGRMPSFIYDLSKVLDRDTCPPTVIVTGDLDFLHEDDRELYGIMKEKGIEVKFYDAVSEGERQMYHVYPISSPTWPEGKHVIEMISDNANGR